MIGYETPNILINLGTISFLLAQYFTKLIVLPLIWYIKPHNWVYKSLKNKMVFSEILMILSEAYLELLVVSSLNIQSGREDPDTNAFNDVLRFILLSFAVVMFVTSIFIIAQKKSKLQEKVFLETWG